MTRSRTSSDRPKLQIGRYLPGVLGALLVAAGVAVVAGFYFGVIPGAGIGVFAVGVFLLLVDRRIP